MGPKVEMEEWDGYVGLEEQPLHSNIGLSFKGKEPINFKVDCIVNDRNSNHNPYQNPLFK